MRSHVVLGSVAALFLIGSAVAVTGGRGISQQGSFLQSGSGATLRTIESKFRDSVSVLDFGADPTGGTDSAPAIQNAINSVTAGAEVDFPQGSYKLNSPIAISRNVFLRGAGHKVATLTAPAGACIFTVSGTIREWRVTDLRLVGNGASSCVVDMTALAPVGEGWYAFERNVISNFGTTAITFGTSQYICEVRDNTFDSNAGSLYVGNQSDCHINHNFFENSTGSNPVITLVGPDMHIVDNYFIHGSGASGTGPDILFAPTGTAAIQSAGLSFVKNNKFGWEGEVANRPRIVCSASNATYVCAPVAIVNNTFLGDDGISSPGTSRIGIRLNNPVYGWRVSGNSFMALTTIVDDIQSVVGNTGGDSVFASDNVMLSRDPTAPTVPTTVFTNGGAQFESIGSPQGAAERSVSIDPRDNESLELRNRILWSEDLSNASWTKSGVTIGTGQTDPYGGTRAQLLTRANAATFESVTQSINTTGMANRIYVKFWAKSGTASTIVVNVGDNTVGGYVSQQDIFRLSSGWRQYKLSVAPVVAAHTHTLYLYPAGVAQTSGTITVFGFQVSDYDSDYAPTTTVVVGDTSTGNRWERAVVAASASNKGSVALVAGTKTVTVAGVSICTCNDTTTIANPCKGTVATTTLTLTGTGTDTVSYLCL